MRTGGILLPVASLPSKYGIGGFSKEAYEFVDFLKKAHQTYWQVLPMGPTGYGDSPYQSFSTFAGNPYFIDLEDLVERGWLTGKECEKLDACIHEEKVDYALVYSTRFKLLRKAFAKSDITSDKKYRKFVKENAFWLNDYALFMTLKGLYKGQSYVRWNDGDRKRKPAVIKSRMKDPAITAEMEVWKFMQFMFYTQYDRLKKYANDNGIKIIGDIPIYVAMDSADTWANPELFKFDKDNMPVGVAGCPPDYFSPTGQLWGNPLYNWEYHKETGYKWWIKRLEYCFKLYDVVRIDHFRGFDEYYFIPYGDKTAEHGHWEKGPGYDLFAAVKKALGERPIIAEDLGFLTPSVRRLVKKCGYPGMKILEFAFDSNEDNDYLPHNYDKNCVVYTGTHDNDTTIGWFSTLGRKDREYAKKYLGIKNARDIAGALVRMAHMSTADTCIIPMQDYLKLGSISRINTPSTLGNNWDWRMKNGVLTDKLAEEIAGLTDLYGRYSK